MAHRPEAYEAWKQLNDEWKLAFANARAARASRPEAFAACRDGVGTGPTEHQLLDAETWEQQADSLKARIDELIKTTFG